MPCPEGGFERLLVINGESRVVFGLGFGPRKGLLGEDTLRIDLGMGKLQTTIGAGEKLQELIKVKKAKEEPEKVVSKNWGPRSMPRGKRS